MFQFSIANWFNNKVSASVLSYDDWYPGHAYAIKELIERDMVATFYTPTCKLKGEYFYEPLREAVRHGIEVANHTINHKNLLEISHETKRLEHEIDDARLSLDKGLAGLQTCLTFCYPYGDFDEEVLTEVKKHHIGARTVLLPEQGWIYDFVNKEDDYFKIPTTEIDPSFRVEDFIAVIEEGIAGSGLTTFMIHGVNDNGYHSISLDIHSNVLDTLKKYEEKVWITTLANAVKYHKEKRNAVVEIVFQNDNSIALKLSHTLDTSVYNHPLTLCCSDVPLSFVSSISQNGKEINALESDVSFCFNAMPDSSEIIIELNN